MDIFFTGHRYICSLTKKISRITDGDYFRDRHREQTEENLLRPIYIALRDSNTQSLTGLHSFPGADITGRVACQGNLSFWKAFKDCDIGINSFFLILASRQFLKTPV